MKLDRVLMDAQNNHWDREAQRARGKLVLLVEGADDAIAIEAALKSRQRSWPTHTAVIPMGGRDKVLTALKNGALPGTNASLAHSGLSGLVDRDVWTAAEVQAEEQKNPTLVVTPGWCMENAFLEAQALRDVIFGEAPADPAVALADLQAELEAARAEWVSAGAWWCSLQRRRDEVQRWFDVKVPAYGHRVPFPLNDPTQLESELQRRLGGGSNVPPSLTAASLAAEVVAEVQRRLALPIDAQWRSAVCGKAVFKDVVIPFLDRRLGKRTPDGWRDRFGPVLRQQTPFDALIAQLIR